MEEISPQTQGSKKKFLYIGAGVVVVIILGALFMGVGGRGTGLGAAYFAAPEGVDVDSNADGTVTYSNEEGSVTIGSGTGMPSNWPSDAPSAYSGATIAYSGTTNPATGAAGSAIVYQTNASLSAVIEYYDSRLKAEGWTIESNTDTAGFRVIVAKKDSRTMAVYVQDAGNGVVGVTAGIEL